MDEKPDFQHPQLQTTQPAYGQVFNPLPNIQDLNDKLDRLQQDFNNYKNERINLNTDIIGLFETVTAAPTLIPTSPYQQVKIAIISGTTYLYIYDPTQQTGGSASNGWFRVAIA